MPVIHRERGFRFFFYSNEGEPREPAHVHIRAGRDEAKFWLRPEVRLAYNDGFGASTLRDLMRVVEKRRSSFESAWDDYFR